MFLMLGAIYAVLGLVSVLMIREPREARSENICQKEALGSEEEVNLRPTEVLRTLTFYQVNFVMCLVGRSVINLVNNCRSGLDSWLLVCVTVSCQTTANPSVSPSSTTTISSPTSRSSRTLPMECVAFSGDTPMTGRIDYSFTQNKDNNIFTYDVIERIIK